MIENRDKSKKLRILHSEAVGVPPPALNERGTRDLRCPQRRLESPPAAATLLGTISDKAISETFREEILSDCADPEREFAAKKDKQACQKLLSVLEELKARPIAGGHQESPGRIKKLLSLLAPAFRARVSA